MQRYAIVAFLSVLLWADLASAQWGTLRGRVVLEGDVPEVKPLVKGPVRDLPAGAVVPDDSLVIDPKTKGIANVAVWLAKKPDRINDDLIEALPEIVTMNTVGLRFEPHLLVVHTSQKIEFMNQDPVNHNARISPIKNPAFNMIVAANGQTPQMELKIAERIPVQVSDQIYPWMGAFLIVVDHPYATITDKDGNFEIPKLPVGEHEFKVWHERVGYLVKDAVHPKRGLIVQIADGEPTVVPDILVPVKTLTEPKR